MRSTNKRSSGVTFGPASSSRIRSSLRVRDSLSSRFCPLNLSIWVSCACLARSPPSGSTIAGFFNSCRNAGNAVLSPFCARSVRASSSSPVCVVPGLLTSFPPFTALVQVKAGSQQRGAGSQVHPLVYDLQFGVEGLQFIYLLALFKGFQPSLFPLQGIHLGHQRGYLSGTEILTNDSAVHLANTVVVASLPSH